MQLDNSHPNPEIQGNNVNNFLHHTPESNSLSTVMTKLFNNPPKVFYPLPTIPAVRNIPADPKIQYYNAQLPQANNFYVHSMIMPDITKRVDPWLSRKHFDNFPLPNIPEPFNPWTLPNFNPFLNFWR